MSVAPGQMASSHSIRGHSSTRRRSSVVEWIGSVFDRAGGSASAAPTPRHLDGGMLLMLKEEMQPLDQDGTPTQQTSEDCIQSFISSRRQTDSMFAVTDRQIKRAKTVFKKYSKSGALSSIGNLMKALSTLGYNVPAMDAQAALDLCSAPGSRPDSTQKGGMPIEFFVCMYAYLLQDYGIGGGVAEGNARISGQSVILPPGDTGAATAKFAKGSTSAGNDDTQTKAAVATNSNVSATSKGGPAGMDPDKALLAKFYGKSAMSLVSDSEMRGGQSIFVINHLGPRRSSWDIIMFVACMVTIMVVPVQIAFYDEVHLGQWFWISLIIDFLGLADVVCNFFTTFSDADGNIVRNAAEIRSHYLRGWFFWDLIGVLPVDLIMRATGGGNNGDLNQDPSLLRLTRGVRVPRMLRALRLIKLAKLPRIFQYFRQWEDHIRLNSSLQRILQLLFMMGLFTHWNACIQWIMADVFNFPENSWIQQNDLLEDPVGVKYSWCLFTVLSHMLCIGYGNIPPTEYYEMWATTISMACGASFFALFIGNLSTLMLNIDAGGAMFSQKMEMYEDYMRWRKLPPELRGRVRDYFAWRWKHRQLFDERAMLTELSSALRTDISLFMARDLVQQVPFFQNADEGFLSSVVAVLQPQTYLPSDLICIRGEIASSMFFIRSGDVEIVIPPNKVVTTLSAGSYFGEMALLNGSKRGASVRAKTHCDLYVLDAPNFNRLMREYPDSDMAKAMVAVAKQRAKTTAVAEKTAKTKEESSKEESGESGKAGKQDPTPKDDKVAESGASASILQAPSVGDEEDEGLPPIFGDLAGKRVSKRQSIAEFVEGSNSNKTNSTSGAREGSPGESPDVVNSNIVVARNRAPSLLDKLDHLDQFMDAKNKKKATTVQPEAQAAWEQTASGGGAQRKSSLGDSSSSPLPGQVPLPAIGASSAFANADSEEKVDTGSSKETAPRE